MKRVTKVQLAGQAMLATTAILGIFATVAAVIYFGFYYLDIWFLAIVVGIGVVATICVNIYEDMVKIARANGTLK